MVESRIGTGQTAYLILASVKRTCFFTVDISYALMLPIMIRIADYSPIGSYFIIASFSPNLARVVV